eukprot:PITA_12763
MASRLILIKTVLQAMPLYLFSVLAAPKWVLKSICNLQRNFLWGCSGLNRKWALVNWNEVCQPKAINGLGLRDPLQSNNTMGARVWWNWLSKPHTPWARLWQEKYVPGCQWKDLIRICPTTPGSLIWNAAKLHSAFIQEHSFWEVHSASTWQANWQGESYTEIEQELNQRKIKQSDQHDKLHWGQTPKGMFTTKEAHHIRYTPAQANKDKLWDQVWKPGIWPKVSTFLWLLGKQRILTWDKLQKRGFIGPSRCPNCNLNAEIDVHLMDTCPLATQLWEKIDNCNRRFGRRQGDIAKTIINWPRNPFQSSLLNSLWNLIPGFSYWILWKERNNRVFNNSSKPIDTLWLLLQHNLRETLALRQ